ncbi:hypothetical protein EHW67_13540 [Arenibacter aquaticus]|uniref:Uncharacterized protein n=1 Tax=Arenibacter aquaticus TaxID=2489054 RepID=A0A3S0C5Q4_9FLAO|nr:hypothetical protein [Arenibacter aquaticus]RTE52697.1 hypothetical protein EHW67_13540 [Arenibacter aquaticus]
MKSTNMGKQLLIVAMALATAWAIRGQFGHEQGAAWAGAIGGLALVLVSGRKDWYNKMMLIALASAVGWGAGGMISYGKVVGYGFADNFINAYYGLAMLFVIGGLFGLLGGGLVGLTLDSTKENKVRWGALLSEMAVGGLISYYFLIEQIGFKMTPPRSEAWAVCLGAGLAMLWYMAREKRNSAIRVAFYAMLGGGIGFSFGNFLHVLGNTWHIPFNTWNIMEYSIGFFGGWGMAYGVFSSKWPKEIPSAKKWENWSALLIVVLFIPLIVYRESLTSAHIARRLESLPNIESVASTSTLMVLLVLLVMVVSIFWKFKKQEFSQKDVLVTFFTMFIAYTFMSYAVTGIFGGEMHLNHHLYVLNILMILVLIRSKRFHFSFGEVDKIDLKKWLFYLIIVLLVIAIWAVIAINVHGDMGDRNRFPIG